MYSRIAHFRMWLDRLQGLDVIPLHILRRVKSYLGQLPVVQPTAVRMRQVLKEVNASAYTNSIPALYLALYNKTPPTLTPSERLRAESMFLRIEKCFEDNIKGRHPRKNLLSYSFLLHQILEEIGVVDRFVTLKTLKHADKKREAWEVWAMLLEDLQK